MEELWAWEREKEYEQRNKEVASGLSVGAPMKIYAFMLIHLNPWQSHIVPHFHVYLVSPEWPKIQFLLKQEGCYDPRQFCYFYWKY